MSKDGQVFSACQKISLVDMGISNCGAVFADLVSAPRDPKAFTSNIPLPAGGSTTGEQFHNLADRSCWSNVGIP